MQFRLVLSGEEDILELQVFRFPVAAWKLRWKEEQKLVNRLGLASVVGADSDDSCPCSKVRLQLQERQQ